MGPAIRRGGGGGGGVAIRWGKATAAWSSGNTVTLTPCAGAADGTATGESNVTAYICLPTGAAPRGVQIAANDIIAFMTDDAGVSVLLPVVHKPGIDIKQAGTLVKAGAQHIDLNGYGMQNCFEFTTDSDGVIIRAKNQPSVARYSVYFWDGSTNGMTCGEERAT